MPREASAAAREGLDFTAATCQRMSRKNGNRFSEKIMLKQRDEIMIDWVRSDRDREAGRMQQNCAFTAF
jgi:hypothetical protein